MAPYSTLPSCSALGARRRGKWWCQRQNRRRGKAEPEPAAEAAPETKAEPDPAAEEEPEAKAEPEPAAEEEPAASVEPKQAAEAAPEAKAEPEPAAEEEPETKAEPATKQRQKRNQSASCRYRNRNDAMDITVLAHNAVIKIPVRPGGTKRAKTWLRRLQLCATQIFAARHHFYRMAS